MVPMKEQLQQIQAVAIVTFLCVLISVHSDGDYGKWFVVDGIGFVQPMKCGSWRGDVTVLIKKRL